GPSPSPRRCSAPGSAAAAPRPVACSARPRPRSSPGIARVPALPSAGGKPRLICGEPGSPVQPSGDRPRPSIVPAKRAASCHRCGRRGLVATKRSQCQPAWGVRMQGLIRFCPRCATPLNPRQTGGRERLACPGPDCGFVFYDNPLPVVAGLVEHEGDVLLVRSVGWPESWYGLVTGFLER